MPFPRDHKVFKLCSRCQEISCPFEVPYVIICVSVFRFINVISQENTQVSSALTPHKCEKHFISSPLLLIHGYTEESVSCSVNGPFDVTIDTIHLQYQCQYVQKYVV